MSKEKKNIVSPTRVTDQQFKWLKDQSEKSGNPIASIIRQLISDKMREERDNAAS